MNLHSVQLEPGEILTEPVATDEVKSFLRVDHDSEDGTIADLIVAAREAAELHHNRILTRRKFRLALNRWPKTREIDLLDPLISVEQVNYKNASGVVIVLEPNTAYIVDTWSRPGRLLLPKDASWPSEEMFPGTPISITFTAGYLPEDVPYLVKAGMRMAITSWFDNRDQNDREMRPINRDQQNYGAPEAAIRCWEVDRLERP